jgi:hypothetical protein
MAHSAASVVAFSYAGVCTVFEHPSQVLQVLYLSQGAAAEVAACHFLEYISQDNIACVFVLQYQLGCYNRC